MGVEDGQLGGQGRGEEEHRCNFCCKPFCGDNVFINCFHPTELLLVDVNILKTPYNFPQHRSLNVFRRDWTIPVYAMQTPNGLAKFSESD